MQRPSSSAVAVVAVAALASFAACADEPADSFGATSDTGPAEPDAATPAPSPPPGGPPDATAPDTAIPPAPPAPSEDASVAPPPPAPPPEMVTWDLVFSTISSRCQPCHAPPFNRGGLRLDDATLGYDGLVGAAATTRGCSGETRVVPGDPEGSVLYHKVTGIGLCGGARMPPSPRAPLDGDALALVERWIAGGALR